MSRYVHGCMSMGVGVEVCPGMSMGVGVRCVQVCPWV